MTESTNNPLQYFEELLTSNKYDILKRNFVNKTKSDSGNKLHSFDIHKGIVKTEYDDGEGKIGISTLIFDKDFEKEIIEKGRDLISNIDSTVVEMTKKGLSYSEYIKVQNKAISSLQEKSKTHYPEKSFILETLTNIKLHISERYKLEKPIIKNKLKKTNNNPLEYFDSLINQFDIDFEIEDFYMQFQLDFGGNILKLDPINDHIHYHNPDNGKVEDYSFKRHFEGEVKSQTKKIIKNINETIIKISIEGKNSKHFISSILKILFAYHRESIVKFSDYKFVSEEIFKMTKIVQEFQQVIFDEEKTITTSTFIYSFDIQETPEKNISKIISELYKSLTTSPPLISCSENEFTNAFSGKKISAGINWLVLGKSKLYSKPSLFYLLNQLINRGFLQKEIINDINKYVLYVFRDNHGNKIKNIKQSKAFISNNPASKERIDAIIASL